MQNIENFKEFVERLSEALNTTIHIIESTVTEEKATLRGIDLFYETYFIFEKELKTLTANVSFSDKTSLKIKSSSLDEAYFIITTLYKEIMNT